MADLNEVLDREQFEECRDLLQSIYGENVRLEIFDVGNMAVYDSCTNGEVNSGQKDGELVTSFGSDLLDIQAEKIGSLELKVNLTDNTTFIDHQKLVDCIAQDMGEKYSLNLEVIQMADELADRYNELNILYDTEKRPQINKFSHDNLSTQLRSCIDLLSLATGSLFLPTKNINIEMSADHVTSEILGLQKDILGRIDAYEFNEKALILNQVQGHAIGKIDQYKLLIVPIISFLDDREGYIVVSRLSSDADFSNSDKNLMLSLSNSITNELEMTYDQLTGVFNREPYELLLEEELTVVRRGQVRHIVVILDIDNMRVINDMIGTSGGDAIIKKVALLITKHVRSCDTVARIGSGNFAILLKDCGIDHASRIAHKIQRDINELRSEFFESHFEITASIGLSIMDSSIYHSTDALSEADVALDVAKELGNNQIEVFEKDSVCLVERKEEIKWIGKIKEAMHSDQFCLFAQPIVSSLAQGGIHHYEILLRLNGDDGLILPHSFLPAAERYGLMQDIDAWVISRLVAEIAKYATTIKKHKIAFAANLSGQSIGDIVFHSFLEEQISRHNISPESLSFEITETSAISSLDLAKQFISSFKSRGHKFSLDDFGTGLSSFSYLRELDVDYLKIDGIFIKNILHDRVCQAMVSSIQNVCHAMNIETIAEVVESGEVLEYLRNVGIDYIQGYHTGNPVPLSKVLRVSN